LTTTTTNTTTDTPTGSTLSLPHGTSGSRAVQEEAFFHGGQQSCPSRHHHQHHRAASADEEEEKPRNDASNPSCLSPPFPAPSYSTSPDSPRPEDLLSWSEIESWSLYIPNSSVAPQAEPILHLIFKGGKSDVWKVDPAIREHPLDNPNFYKLPMMLTERGTMVSFKASSQMDQGSPHAQSSPIPIGRDQFAQPLAQQASSHLHHHTKLENWSLLASHLRTIPVSLFQCLPLGLPTPDHSPEPPPFSPLSPPDPSTLVLMSGEPGVEPNSEHGDHPSQSTRTLYRSAHSGVTDGPVN